MGRPSLMPRTKRQTCSFCTLILRTSCWFQGVRSWHCINGPRKKQLMNLCFRDPAPPGHSWKSMVSVKCVINLNEYMYPITGKNGSVNYRLHSCAEAQNHLGSFSRIASTTSNLQLYRVQVPLIIHHSWTGNLKIGKILTDFESKVFAMVYHRS